MFRVELWAQVGDDPGHLAGMPDLVIEAMVARSKEEAERRAEEDFHRSMRASGIKRVVHAEATEIVEER